MKPRGKCFYCGDKAIALKNQKLMCAECWDFIRNNNENLIKIKKSLK